MSAGLVAWWVWVRSGAHQMSIVREEARGQLLSEPLTLRRSAWIRILSYENNGNEGLSLVERTNSHEGFLLALQVAEACEPCRPAMLQRALDLVSKEFDPLWKDLDNVLLRRAALALHADDVLTKPWEKEKSDEEGLPLASS